MPDNPCRLCVRTDQGGVGCSKVENFDHRRIDSDLRIGGRQD